MPLELMPLKSKNTIKQLILCEECHIKLTNLLVSMGDISISRSKMGHGTWDMGHNQVSLFFRDIILYKNYTQGT